LKVIR